MLASLPGGLRSAGLATVAALAAGVAVYLGWHLGLRGLTATLPIDAWPKWAVNGAVIFGAATISSVVGFAFSAIAGAPLLHLVANSIEAVQIMMVASIGIQAYSLCRLWPAIQWRRCAPFLAGGVATLPIGVGLLLILEPRAYLSAVGAMLICYGAYMLVRPPPRPSRCGRHRLADALIGAVGGITGPLAALPGIWVTIWCGTRGWSKVEQRAVYQPYILVMQVLAFAALCMMQRRSPTDPAWLGYALPGLAGAMVGLRVFHSLSDGQFQKILNVALVISGLALTLK
jgi:hypothetical protein